MPLIGWATDLHLDHASPQCRETLHTALRSLSAETVILTGDTSVAGRLAEDLAEVVSAAGRPVHFVLGNHDHYGSSVGNVRESVIKIDSDIRWLPPTGVVAMDADSALVGVDGWADGSFGDPLRTPVVLNDDRWIAELAGQDTRRGKLAVKRVLAEADADRLRTLLDRAAGSYRHVVVATHVPPFPESLPRGGHLAGPEWLPLMVCGATGRVLREFAAAHPGHAVTVLAGHTHIATDVRITANLRCLVGGARYGAPEVRDIVV